MNDMITRARLNLSVGRWGADHESPVKDASVIEVNGIKECSAGTGKPRMHTRDRLLSC